jgi:hypothetical protein
MSTVVLLAETFFGIRRATMGHPAAAPGDLRDAPNSGAYNELLQNSGSNDVPAVNAIPPAPEAGIRAWTMQDSRNNLLWHKSNEGDTAERLYKDAKLAIEYYEQCSHGKKVTYSDDQRLVSPEFYLNSGLAHFNPNSAQTNTLEETLNAIMAKEYKPNQALVIFEALVATDGNVTLAMGSLAELFCRNRNEYIRNVRDMQDADGKNYYRFAGMFIGLHPTLIRMAGGAAAYSNIVGNPIVFAGVEIVQWWGDFLKGKPVSAVDTLHTMGPYGRGNLIDKIPELKKGLDAASALRKWNNRWAKRFV